MEDDFDCDSDEYEQAVAAVEEEMENDMAGGQVETDGEAEGIITPFNLDHIITYPGLRIQIDQFSINTQGN